MGTGLGDGVGVGDGLGDGEGLGIVTGDGDGLVVAAPGDELQAAKRSSDAAAVNNQGRMGASLATGH